MDEAVEECAAGVLRSLGEGRRALAGFAEGTKGTKAVKPWGFTNKSGVCYRQKMANPALMRIGLNIVRRIGLFYCYLMTKGTGLHIIPG